MYQMTKKKSSKIGEYEKYLIENQKLPTISIFQNACLKCKRYVYMYETSF